VYKRQGREFDLADEVTSALWVHSDTAHAGCRLADAWM